MMRGSNRSLDTLKNSYQYINSSDIVFLLQLNVLQNASSYFSNQSIYSPRDCNYGHVISTPSRAKVHKFFSTLQLAEMDCCRFILVNQSNSSNQVKSTNRIRVLEKLFYASTMQFPCQYELSNSFFNILWYTYLSTQL